MKYLVFTAACSLLACTGAGDERRDEQDWVELPNRYAEYFSISAKGEDRRVVVIGPGGRDTIASFVVGDGGGLTDRFSVPDRIAVLSTTHLPFISALGRADRVVAATDLPRVRDAATRMRIDEGQLIDIAAADGIDREQLLASRAQIMLDYPFGQIAQRAAITGVQFVPVTEYLEEHPLGRAEWIRFFGALLGEEEMADSLFAAIAARYETTKALVADVPERPKVFFGSSWQGQWHLPPGNSYMARLIGDAGGDHLFNGRVSSGNIALDLETVITEARSADRFGVVMAHGGEVRMIDIAGGDLRVAELPVLAHHAFYMDSERSDIFGEALLEPDVLLLDLIQVLHQSKFHSASPKYVFQPVQ